MNLRKNLLAAGAGLLVAQASAASPQEAAPSAHPIVEFRQYTLYPGQRDVLIDLFERHFIESQNEVGMEVLAHYRDLDAPDAFVWFRGFRDMASRGEALPAFYLHGEAWRTYREPANATIADSDNVLLLHEARPGSGFAPASGFRPAFDASLPPQRVLATTYSLSAPADPAFIEFFERELAPAATAAGAKILAAYATEHSANNFPRLPVRENENVFVWVAGFADRAALDRYRGTLTQSDAWRAAQAKLSAWTNAAPVERRLAPAARSLPHD